MDLTTLSAACDATERIVAGVAPAQFDQPTPCREWDVRALLNHLVGTLVLGTALLSDTPPAVAMGPGQLPVADLLDGDPLTAYRTGVETLLAAAGDGALERSHQTPFGEMPGSVLGGFTTLDIAVHGWDLARATGQDGELDGGLAAPLLAFARGAITADTRAPRIGPALEPPPGATLTQQLVAYLGRQP